MTPPGATRRRRVLFVAEAVTLAHVARPAALAAALDPALHEVFIACDPHSQRFIGADAGQRLDISSLAPALFAERLRQGRPVLEEAELSASVRADQDLLARIAPDLVVGDFRLSLSVSARLAGVPYAAISNAYWSPYAPGRSLPLPVLPWTRHVPLGLAQALFDRVQRIALAPHCRPLNRVRAAHGLPPLPADLRRAYTDADHVLYADSPALFPLRDAPSHHRHLGPVLWSPPLPLPPWWHEVPDDRPLVYVTMGSSGAAGLLERVIDALAGPELNLIVAAAGASLPAARWRNVWLADYLPGEAAAARAGLVVCNGGSPTSQQALAAGRPVLGVCGNMDQFLNMRGLQAAGLGVALRADRLDARTLAAAARGLLARGVPVPPAASAPDAKAVFRAFVDGLPAPRER